ncbi:MAG: copper chaperone PCu(A)C [Methylophilaceae bacterium]
MKKIISIILLLMSSPLLAEIVFKDPIIKNNFGKKITAGFATISSDEDLEIVSISSKISKRIEVHTMLMEGDVMKMRKIDSPVIIKNKPFALKKSGDHLMIYELTENLDDLKNVAFTFTFKNKSGEIINKDIDFLVQ